MKSTDAGQRESLPQVRCSAPFEGIVINDYHLRRAIGDSTMDADVLFDVGAG